MPSADDLEGESRQAESVQSPYVGRRALRNANAAKRHTLDVSSDTSFLPSSRDHRFSAFIPGSGKTTQPTPEKKARKHSASADALAAIFGGTPQDFEASSKTRAPGRHNSTVGIGGKSSSPSSRVRRASTMSLGAFNNNRSSPMHIMTDSSDLQDIGDVGKGESKANEKSPKKASESIPGDGAGLERHGSADWSKNTRLEKDRPMVEGREEGAVESSEDDEEAKSSDDEEESTPGRKRGRRRIRAASRSDASQGTAEESEDDQYASLYGQNESSRRAKSALAAAEEERMAQSKAKIAWSAPAISVTGPGGERLGSNKKGGVHPNTSYDDATSSLNSATSSDADISDIRRAQKLSINMSHIDTSVPNRVIRTILRGDFSTMQEEEEEGLRRQRLYLVATDLSDEAVYALEWTIGTILRDGDTLLAIYAIDEETGTGKSVDTDPSSIVQIGDGARAAQDTVDAMTSQTENMKNQGSKIPSLFTAASYMPATSTDSRPGSVDARMRSKADIERQRAIEDISSTCVRLLRKTKLQVRVAIEVIHCKSPKHMITEAIDGLEPTLVILGSRGRSALKGVLLGSFSNYLVTKSSVPVMVARKKLRKHAKFKKTNFRLSNNLQRPNRLTSAIVD